ncbi:F-box only protein 2 [Python bivittatus]|uniref:F-box only protein 2 n=1 Tax=Python bivittatus TaxID=176946 RepID=A0A9F2N8U4_PYTBI|nr:F-box only protein 2 [Python bivittatus]
MRGAVVGLEELQRDGVTHSFAKESPGVSTQIPDQQPGWLESDTGSPFLACRRAIDRRMNPAAPRGLELAHGMDPLANLSLQTEQSSEGIDCGVPGVSGLGCFPANVSLPGWVALKTWSSRVRILASLPASQLVLVCRLVCSQWKALVDGAALWLLKCQAEGFARQDAEAEGADSWQTLYFLNKRKRNLIRNPNGEEGLQYWENVQNGGDGWKVEELPGDFGKDFPSDEVHTYFVSSFDWCSKSQVIDLRAEGYWEELMDTVQPKIVAKDWYAARCDAGCLYNLKVKLLSANEDVVAEFASETIAVPQDNEGEWAEITHTFAEYGPGVRFIHFEHGGQDTVFWKGWYGARVASSTVLVEP